ncbi:MAG: hypothetical protein J7L45_01000 [Candidatus Aenigmarchaeota archaeon]|nr:hypothetical protein [Candidatus Aenigmarchaeota archaeon]
MKGTTERVLVIIILIILAIVLLYVSLKFAYYGKKYPELMNNTTNVKNWSEKIKNEVYDINMELIYKCPVKEGFHEVCANEERNGDSSLLKKVNDCSGLSCMVRDENIDYTADDISGGSNWYMSPDCSKLTHFEDPWDEKYDDITVSLFVNSVCHDSEENEIQCKRADKIVGQCLRLDFKGYYGKSIYVDYLCYRSGAGCYFNGLVSTCKDIPPSLYVFICPDGKECYDNGNGWEMIEGPNEGGAFKSENAFEKVKIDEKVSMIDLCPLNYNFDKSTAPHKIAWVKFTTNDPDI